MREKYFVKKMSMHLFKITDKIAIDPKNVEKSIFAKHHRECSGKNANKRE